MPRLHQSSKTLSNSLARFVLKSREYLVLLPRVCYTSCPILYKNSGAKSAPLFHSTVLCDIKKFLNNNFPDDTKTSNTDTPQMFNQNNIENIYVKSSVIDILVGESLEIKYNEYFNN